VPVGESKVASPGVSMVNNFLRSIRQCMHRVGKAFSLEPR
jgi:hypothetical protein